MIDRTDARAEALHPSNHRIRQAFQCTRLLTVMACLLLAPLHATLQHEQALTEVVQHAIDRLDLSEEQSAHLLPIFRSHFEAQMACLEQFGAESDEGTDHLEEAQALGRHMRSNDQALEAEVAKILSDAQMSEFRHLQEEGREAVHEELFASGMQQLGRTLKLSDAQLGAAEPILANQLQSLLAIFDKHGVELKGTSKASTRTLLALRRDTNAVNARTLEQLSAILSEEQLAEYQVIQEAETQSVGDRLR